MQILKARHEYEQPKQKSNKSSIKEILIKLKNTIRLQDEFIWKYNNIHELNVSHTTKHIYSEPRVCAGGASAIACFRIREQMIILNNYANIES